MKDPRMNRDIRVATSSDVGGLYSREQVEFMFAMAALQKRLKRQPSWPEVLREAIRLGYRRAP